MSVERRVRPDRNTNKKENAMTENYLETEAAPAGRTKRHRRAVAAGAVLAVIGVGVGGVALHQHGVQQGHRRVSDTSSVTAPSSDPTIAGTAKMCGGRFVVTVGTKRYLLVDSGVGDAQTTLIDIDANQRDEPCAKGAPDASQTAQNLIGWDRDTQGCVRLAVVDGRQWILSSGWGLIPADGRIAGTEKYGKEASEHDDSRCRPTIWFGEKNADGTTPTDPAPPTVPPVEDTRGYLIDSRVQCPWDDSKWEQFHFVPTLNTCVPFATDGAGFKVRGDAADDTVPR